MKAITLALLTIFVSLLPPKIDVNMSKRRMNNFLKSGSLMGFFTINEFKNWFNFLRADLQNQTYLSDLQSFGKSLEDQDMLIYYISSNINNLENDKRVKNIIMITGMHHSREPLTISTAMHMTMQILKELRSTKHNAIKALMRDNILAFMPIVNIDSYRFIIEHYEKGDSSEKVMMIRKNRRINTACDEYTGGVDLNRNYDFMFGLNNEGSSDNPCAEDYRGERAFSEPETQSIRDFVDNNPTIVTGINLHSYGNAWIYPYNYVNDGKNLVLMNQKPLFEKFYEDFVAQMQKHKYKALFGNAAFTLDYPTNGEAGDWLTGAKGILNMDLEVGNLDPRSEQFYPPRMILDRIINYNWIAMRHFLSMHVVNFELEEIVVIKDQPIMLFEIFNKSISSLHIFTANLTLNFKTGSIVTGHKLEYGYKKLGSEEALYTSIIDNKLEGPFKGRHILEIKITFNAIEDMHELESITLEIERTTSDISGYPHQLYTFKINQSDGSK